MLAPTGSIAGVGSCGCVTVTTQSPVEPSAAVTVYVTGFEKSCALPLGGEMLQMSYGKCALFSVLREKVGDNPIEAALETLREGLNA